MLNGERGPDAGGRPDQLSRMSAEIGYLLGRLIGQSRQPGASRGRLLAESRWWAACRSQPLLAAVRRGFLARQLCLRAADSDGTWRNSLSYIGEPPSGTGAVCTYEYDRADVSIAASSALARPYPWLAGDGAVPVWYARTGMSAIVAWLVTVARMAAERGQQQLVLTNDLYYETGLLFQSARLEHVAVRSFPDTAALLAAMAAATGPVAVFLDSSRPDGDAMALSRVLGAADPERVGCVVWDNTCIPAFVDPLGDTVPGPEARPTLLLIRSHAKLDQLGLELCSLGSITMLPGGQTETRQAAAWRDAMRELLPDCLSATGSCASPAALRLIAALGLPSFRLSAAANQRLCEANTLAGRLLAAGLEPTGRYRVQQHPHGCFTEIHLPELPAPARTSQTASWPAWGELKRQLAALEQDAARNSIPVWRSASFGFHYTGLTWYASDSQPRGRPHTVLRVCVGMHDEGVTAQVAALVKERLAAMKAGPAGS
jgi:hypothetical protein